jgi:periplasmic protein TonB
MKHINNLRCLYDQRGNSPAQAGVPGHEGDLGLDWRCAMFEASLLDSSTTRQPVLGTFQWLVALGIGFLGFLIGAMKLPAAATPDGTNIVLVRALIVGGGLMFYSLSVCYAFKDARRQGFNPWFWAAVVVVANLPGFVMYLVVSALRTGDWKRATLPIAYAFEVLLVCFAALLPLIYTQALPGPFNLIKPVLPPSRGASQAPPQQGRSRQQTTQSTTITIPLRIPTVVRYDIHDENPKPPQLAPYIPGLQEGAGGPGAGPLIGFLVPNPGPPPDSPKPVASAPKRIVAASVIEAAKVIYMPRPTYPPLAILARVQGTVRLHAIIGTDGTVQQLTVLSGNPMLVPAAKETVATWRYQPTLLNSEPVEVDTEIDVIFVLNN